MKAVAYSIRSFERQYLAKANDKKHDITLIGNPLGLDTTIYAKGKEAVIVFTNDNVSEPVITQLATLGVKYIITRSTGTDHINKTAAKAHDIQIANIPSYSPQAIAEHAVALALALSRRLILADRNSHNFDFRNEELVGFNFHGKAVGLIGLGSTGTATAKIFTGLGCDVMAFDPIFPTNAPEITEVSLEKLFSTSDIISLHLPLNSATKYIINKTTLDQMKTGVMLINTSRGGLIDTSDVIAALHSGKIGYLGLDVYEHEQSLFFEDHQQDTIKDPLLDKLLRHSNVIVTPHQSYLTVEALQEIADQTISNLNKFSVQENAI